MKPRLYKSTTHYPAYDHTSFNLAVGEGRRYTLTLSFHVRYSWGDGGFWFGLRPEFELTRSTERIVALRKKMQAARMKFRCQRCQKEEWGEEGMRRPRGWEFIYRMDFCDECVATYTYRDLLAHD